MVLKLPESWYLGFANRQNDDAPLGFMTPEGSDHAAMKRKATIDSWRHKETPTRVIVNKLLTGFKLSESIRRYSSWGSGNVKWRVLDPRGFELEISSPNLMQILNCSTVEQGEIQEACIWGREGADNILIPVSSQLYKTAVADTKRQNMKVSLRDIKPGNIVVLQDGTRCQYLGSWFPVLLDRPYYGGCRATDNRATMPSVLDKKRHFFKTLDDRDRINVIASPKVSELEDASEMSSQECFDVIMDGMNNKTISGPSMKYSMVSVTKKSATFVYAERDQTELFQKYCLGDVPESEFGTSYNIRTRYFYTKLLSGYYIHGTSYSAVSAIKNLLEEYAKPVRNPSLQSYENRVSSLFFKVSNNEYVLNGTINTATKSRPNRWGGGYVEPVTLESVSEIFKIDSAFELVVEATIELDDGVFKTIDI